MEDMLFLGGYQVIKIIVVMMILMMILIARSNGNRGYVLVLGGYEVIAMTMSMLMKKMILMIMKKKLLMMITAMIGNGNIQIFGGVQVTNAITEKVIFNIIIVNANMTYQDVGYDTIIIDDCWLDLHRTADGALQVFIFIPS